MNEQYGNQQNTHQPQPPPPPPSIYFVSGWINIVGGAPSPMAHYQELCEGAVAVWILSAATSGRWLDPLCWFSVSTLHSSSSAPLIGNESPGDGELWEQGCFGIQVVASHWCLLLTPPVPPPSPPPTPPPFLTQVWLVAVAKPGVGPLRGLLVQGQQYVECTVSCFNTVASWTALE